MTWQRTLAAATILIGGVCGSARAAPADLKCDSGPVSRNFGGAPWLVYSCHDLVHLLLVAPPVNPASPCIIVLTLDGDRFRVVNVGTGNKRAAADAGRDAERLSLDDFTALIAQTTAR